MSTGWLFFKLSKCIQMNKTIVAISVDTNPKRWVKATSRREDKRLVVELTNDKNEAADFVSAQNAEKTIDSIVNHHGRNYSIERISINVTKSPLDAMWEDRMN